nr:premnaspirodiene oxygenase-like [Ipomoea batatas]
MRLQIGEISAVVVSSPAMAKEILRTHDVAFATKPELVTNKIIFYNCSDIAFCPYGDYWRQMRKICVMELLNGKNVRSFSSIRHDEIHSLLAYVRSTSGHGQLVNFPERMFLLMTSIICRSAFGKVFTGREEFMEQLKEMSELLGSFDFADVFPSWRILHGLYGGNKNRIIKAHRKMDSGDLRVPITHDNIKAIIIDMFAGGSETSTATTVWAMSEMMKNPRVMAKAQTEVREVFKGKETLDEKYIMEQLPYLKLVVKETLRCHPPFPVFSPRECREESIVNGYTIPLKTKVMINAWAIGRDPEYWKDPDSFIPERFEESSIDFTGNHFQYLPFGAGRRMCPGHAFGFANSMSPLAHLLFHFDWKLPNGVTVDSFDMTEKPGLSVGRNTDLCLIATSHIA